MDEEHVAMIQEARDRDGTPDSEGQGPPLSEYTPVVERLDQLVEGIQILQQTIVAANGGKPRPIRPQPRPQTAYDTVKHRRRQAQHDALVGRMLRRSS